MTLCARTACLVALLVQAAALPISKELLGRDLGGELGLDEYPVLSLSSVPGISPFDHISDDALSSAPASEIAKDWPKLTYSYESLAHLDDPSLGHSLPARVLKEDKRIGEVKVDAAAGAGQQAKVKQEAPTTNIAT